MANLSQHAGGGLPSQLLPNDLNPNIRALLDSLIVYWPGNHDPDNKAWFRNRGWVAPDNVTGTLVHYNYMGGTTTFNGTNYIYWDNIDELGWDGSQPFSAVCDLYQSTSANDPLFGVGANTGHSQNGWLVMRNLNTDVYLSVNAAVGYANDQLQCYASGGTASTWQTWAVSYDGSKDDSGVTFFRDGASQATVSGANTLTGDASPATNRFYIGSDSGGSNLNAQIGSIYIFDRELTTNEMSWMTNGILRPYVEYLRADTKFNLGLDTTATAVAATIRSGETAWVGGEKLIGTGPLLFADNFDGANTSGGIADRVVPYGSGSWEMYPSNGSTYPEILSNELAYQVGTPTSPSWPDVRLVVETGERNVVLEAKVDTGATSNLYGSMGLLACYDSNGHFYVATHRPFDGAMNITKYTGTGSLLVSQTVACNATDIETLRLTVHSGGLEYVALNRTQEVMGLTTHTDTTIIGTKHGLLPRMSGYTLKCFSISCHKVWA
jgi:hypothetical protein